MRALSPVLILKSKCMDTQKHLVQCQPQGRQKILTLLVGSPSTALPQTGQVMLMVMILFTLKQKRNLLTPEEMQTLHLHIYTHSKITTYEECIY